jgi:hypothetical protein
MRAWFEHVLFPVRGGEVCSPIYVTSVNTQYDRHSRRAAGCGGSIRCSKIIVYSRRSACHTPAQALLMP